MSTSATKSTKSQPIKKLVKKLNKSVEDVEPAPVVTKSKKPVKKTEVEEELVPSKSKSTKVNKLTEDVESEPAVKSKKVLKKVETTEETVSTKNKITKSVKSKKEEEAEEVTIEEEPKKVKKVKKINDKPTLSDNCGLNLSVAKVKNIISNLCINKEQFAVLKELKDSRIISEEKLDNDICSKDETAGKKKKIFTFTLKGISEESLAFLEKAHQNNLELLKESYAKSKIKKMDDPTRKDYIAQRKTAVIAHQSEQKSGHLFQTHEFNVAEFNIKWDKNFYDEMAILEWKSLKDMELYEYCVMIINKMKVRFNAESKIFVTAFVEYIVQQIVINGTINCVHNKKKIIKMEHALDTSSENFNKHFNLFPLILNLESYHKAIHENSISEDEVESEADADVEADVKLEESSDNDQINRKYQFKYYVAELCRTVKMELARKDNPDDFSKSVYYNVSVSKVFKNFCSSIIVDLIRMFGEVLKVEVATRNVKTVNYTIIQTLVHVAHIMYGLGPHLDETVKFIQQRYCVYQKFIGERKTKRVKSDSAEEDEL